MFYTKLGVDFFSTFELLYPNMKSRLRLIRAKEPDLIFTWLATTPKLVFELLIAHSTLVVLLSRMIITKRKGHACIYSYEVQLLGISSKDFQHSYQTKPFHPRKHFQQCSSSSNCHCNEYKLCIYRIVYWKSFLVSTIWSQIIKILREDQPILDFDDADNCRLYVTTMKAMNFQDDITSARISNFNDHYVIEFDLTSMQDATENCHYPELVGEPLRLELNVTFPLEHIAELLTHCAGRSNVFGWSWKIWCCWKKNIKWIKFLSSKSSTVFHYSNNGFQCAVFHR